MPNYHTATPDYTELWTELGLDLGRHAELMNLLGQAYPQFYLRQNNRPVGMDYFDRWVGDVHGFRPTELRAHRRKGGKVIGAYCVFVPAELVRAAGGIQIVLCGGADFSVPFAEELLPANLCPLIKSSVGFKLGRVCPYVQSTDLLVGENTCDGKKKVWEIFSAYHPFYVLDMPQEKTEAGRTLWRQEVREFKEHLEKLTGNAIDTESLRVATRQINRKRKALQRFHATRRANPAPISGKDALLVSQIAMFDDLERYVEKVSGLTAELERRVAQGVGVAPGNAPRLLISGSPQVIPNWKIHHLVEVSGGVVVGEETCIGTRYYESLTEEDGGSLDTQLNRIADRYLKINCACFTPNEERTEDVVRLANELAVDGVIHYNLMFCQPFSLEYRRIETALQKEGIPSIQIETDYGQGDSMQLLTRIQAFLEEIEAPRKGHLSQRG